MYLYEDGVSIIAGGVGKRPRCGPKLTYSKLNLCAAVFLGEFPPCNLNSENRQYYFREGIRAVSRRVIFAISLAIATVASGCELATANLLIFCNRVSSVNNSRTVFAIFLGLFSQ